MLTKNQNSIKSSGKFWMSREKFLKSLIKQYDSFKLKNCFLKSHKNTILSLRLNFVLALEGGSNPMGPYPNRLLSLRRYFNLKISKAKTYNIIKRFKKSMEVCHKSFSNA